MKFIANREQLLAMVKTVAKVVPSQSPVEILKGILVEAQEGVITFTGTNYESSVRCGTKAYVEECGGMVVNGKLLLQMLSLFAGEDVSIQMNQNNTCTLGSGTARFQLAVHPSKDYPKPELPFPEGAVKITNISSLAKNTVFAASKSEKQQIMTGIRLEINGESVRACGSDGSRLMERQQEAEQGGKLSMILPSQSFRLLADLVSDKDTLEAGTVGQTAVFSKEGFLFSCKLISGAYLDVDSLKKSIRPEYSAVIDAGALYKSLCTVTAVTGESGRVNLSLRNDALQITLSSDTGRSQSSVPGVVMKETPESGFYYSAGYLQEAFRRLSGTVELQLSAVGMLSVHTGNVFYFQVPMREPVPVKKTKRQKEAA